MKNKDIVSKIIDCLCDRNGFDDWWGNIDHEKEIIKDLEKIINE